MSIECPVEGCEAVRIPDHPAGFLVFDVHADNCWVGNAEDSRRYADYSRLVPNRYGVPGAPFVRLTTEAERALLTAAGGVVPVPCATYVRLVTGAGSIIKRTWPTVPLGPTVASMSVSASAP